MEHYGDCIGLQMESWLQEMKLELLDLTRKKSKQYNFDFETCIPNFDEKCNIRWIGEKKALHKLNSSFSNHQDMQISIICGKTPRT